MFDKKISVIIPAYNESSKILNTIEETIQILSGVTAYFQIIIIDDGSNDCTYQLVKSRYNTEEKVQIYKYDQNKGKGYALKYGTEIADGDYILFMDADLDLHPKQITFFLDKIIKSNADAVIGSKKSRYSKVAYSLKRRILSNGYYYFIKILFGLPVRDTQTGFKLFKAFPLKESIKKVLVNRYAFDLELLVILHKKGYKIIECPVEVAQSRQKGRIGKKDVFVVLKDTLKIFYRLYFKNYYI
jgi:dolichol-phosphate mannosyltransferase